MFEAAGEAEQLCDELASGLDGVAVRKRPVLRARMTEIDLWSTPEALSQLSERLIQRGYVPLRDLKEGNHRFFLSHDSVRGWCKVDVKLTRSGGRGSSLAWTLRRRRGPIVAVLGADGAGKSTVIETLAATAPFGLVTHYLGEQRRTRQTEPAAEPAAEPTAEPAARRADPVRSHPLRQLAGIGVWVARTTRRLIPVYAQSWRGRAVICDRHPIEVIVAPDSGFEHVAGLRRLVARAVPNPDHIVLLAAPGEVLHARKGEHDPATLDAMTARNRRLLELRGGTEVDAEQTPAAVLGQMELILAEVLRARHGQQELP